MTASEAIKIIKNYDVYGCGYCHQGGDEVEKAFDIGVKALEQTQWIPVSERVAEFPCFACDIFGQIFIPCGIVVLDSRCYDGKDFAFNVEKFLRGKEVILYGGKKIYEKPKEIVAWMPLPEPYEPQEGASR